MAILYDFLKSAWILENAITQWAYNDDDRHSLFLSCFFFFSSPSILAYIETQIMDNFSAYLLGLLAMMVIEWPFSLLPLLINSTFTSNQGKNAMEKREKTNTSTFQCPYSRSRSHKTSKNSNSKQQQRPTAILLLLAPTILFPFIHSLSQFTPEKTTTTREPNRSAFHRHSHMQWSLPTSCAFSHSFPPLSLSLSHPPVEHHRMKKHLFIRINCNFSCAFSSFYSIIPLYCEIYPNNISSLLSLCDDSEHFYWIFI